MGSVDHSGGGKDKPREVKHEGKANKRYHSKEFINIPNTGHKRGQGKFISKVSNEGEREMEEEQL